MAEARPWPSIHCEVRKGLPSHFLLIKANNFGMSTFNQLHILDNHDSVSTVDRVLSIQIAMGCSTRLFKEVPEWCHFWVSIQFVVALRIISNLCRQGKAISTSSHSVRICKIFPMALPLPIAVCLLLKFLIQCHIARVISLLLIIAVAIHRG